MSKDCLSVSFIIPTLNEESRLEACLDSVYDQDYPKDKIEVLIMDAGSHDRTRDIAISYGARVFSNPLKTSEAGKIVGVKNASHDLICFIDADNILPDEKWLQKMVLPLEKDKKLIGSEALYFTYRPEDGYIDRYCALMGMNDPICLWFGTYDRMNVLTGTWTGLPVHTEKREGYLELHLRHGVIPTIGANGALFRRSVFMENEDLFDDYLFDVDILEQLAQKNGEVLFAKVPVGVIHMYCGSDIRRFAKKQLRRVKDFLYRRSVGDVFVTGNYEERAYTYGHHGPFALLKPITLFSLSCLTVIPLLVQSVRGYHRKPDMAWFAHPILCWVTFLMYARGAIESFFNSQELSRENW